MIHLKKHLDLLGHRVTDKVTGTEGIVTSIGFDLYGCVQAIVCPGLDKDGKIRDSHWFDVNRLSVMSTAPVMQQPAFDYDSPQSRGEQGGADKPLWKS